MPEMEIEEENGGGDEGVEMEEPFLREKARVCDMQIWSSWGRRLGWVGFGV